MVDKYFNRQNLSPTRTNDCSSSCKVWSASFVSNCTYSLQHNSRFLNRIGIMPQTTSTAAEDEQALAKIKLFKHWACVWSNPTFSYHDPKDSLKQAMHIPYVTACNRYSSICWAIIITVLTRLRYDNSIFFLQIPTTSIQWKISNTSFTNIGDATRDGWLNYLLQIVTWFYWYWLW